MHPPAFWMAKRRGLSSVRGLIMKLPRLLSTLAVLLAAPAALHADEAKTYVLAKKGAMPAPGSTLTEKTIAQFGEAKMEYKIEFQTAHGTLTSKETANDVLEGLAPGKMRRTLASKTTESRVVFQGIEEPSPEHADALQGVPVIVEYKDNAWSAALEEGAPDEEQKKALEEVLGNYRMESDLKIYGETPRKPGDKWDVDPKSLSQFAGVAKPEGSFSVEFVEIKDVGGTACAVLKSSFDLSGGSVDHADKGVKMKVKGEALAQRSLADLVDVQTKVTGTMRSEGTPAPGASMTLEGPITMEYAATLEKKKAE